MILDGKKGINFLIQNLYFCSGTNKISVLLFHGLICDSHSRHIRTMHLLPPYRHHVDFEGFTEQPFFVSTD